MKILRSQLASLGIRWRLTVLIAAALLVVLASMFAALRITVTEILESDLDNDVSERMGQISAQLAITGSFDPQQLTELAQQSSFPVAVYDLEGNVVAASSTANTSLHAPSSEELGSLLAGDTITTTVELGGVDYRLRSVRLVVGEEVVGVLQVGRSAETVQRVTSALTWITLGGGIGAVAVVLVVAYILSRSALRPIEEMTELAAEMEASDLTRRIRATGKPSEVQRLADTFDLMLERLENAFDQQKNFVLDVSHELRTPLTALRGNLDVQLMDSTLDDEVREQMERMSSEVGRLIRLTSNLLYLAHAEAGREVASMQVDLDSLCLDVLHEMKGVGSGVALRLDHSDAVTVQGDPDLLKQLLLNLVDNGLKHTAPDGEVKVSLYQEGPTVQVVVEDTGSGIPADQLEHIFERFYRGPNGRNRSGGSGIGLAISRWIAQVHGGDITVETELGRGTKFTVRLATEGKRDATSPATLS